MGMVCSAELRGLPCLLVSPEESTVHYLGGFPRC